ncbi:MAG TPA: helix-turn-helix domain-containing protein [Gaiellaceae bacterium]|nr:helix-turn-helix domain-containing protein [Gaiellaceae bacterium]
MLQRTYDGQNCSIARTLEVVGERWTLLILRDVALGLRRFDEIQANLGVARNVLTDRLERLLGAGILERVRYREKPERFEYVLTAMGSELRVPLLALLNWGDRHLAPDGPPRLVDHIGCGGHVTARAVCDECGEVLAPGAVHSRRVA